MKQLSGTQGVFVLDGGDLAPDIAIFAGRRVELRSLVWPRRLTVRVLRQLVALLERVDLVIEYIGRRKLHFLRKIN